MEIVVFTNGCFDILHPGHVELLKKARQLGTKLIVGINSDDSVRAIKGNPRPYLNQEARAKILSELRSVDEVRIFEENTPANLIKEIKPDVLVKGGDWALEQIVGADFVLENGGKVFSIPFESDFSSSKIVEKIKSSDDNFGSQIPESEFESIDKTIGDYIEVIKKIQKNQLERCLELISDTLNSSNKIIFCGDKESANLSGYLTAEYSARFAGAKIESLNSLAEESGFSGSDFSIQIQNSVSRNDLLIAVSLKGSSLNMISAVMLARQIGCQTIGLTGIEGKKLSSLCDVSFIAPSKDFVKISMLILFINFIWCEIIKSK